MFSETDVHDPKELAFLIRRECLQDLYRFLTLSSFKNSFPKVFSSEQDSIAYFLPSLYLRLMKSLIELGSISAISFLSAISLCA